MIIELVTDRLRLAGPGANGAEVRRCLLAQVAHAVDAAIEVVQVRERDLEARELATLVTDIVAIARGSRTRVVVNERLDVAIACGADGVHLRADSLPAAAVRSIAPHGFLIGRSVHTAAEARASGTAVDYLLAGTVWPSGSKPIDRPLLGVEGLATIVSAALVPVLSIGGVSVDRAGEAAAAGAAGIAGIGLFQGRAHEACGAVPLKELVSRLRESFDTPLPAS